MLSFLGGVSVVSTAFIFIGGAMVGDSPAFGLVLSGLGGAWLGVVYASLIRLASSPQRDPVNH